MSLLSTYLERYCIPRLSGGSKSVPPSGKIQMLSFIPSIFPSYIIFAVLSKTIAIICILLLLTWFALIKFISYFAPATTAFHGEPVIDPEPSKAIAMTSDSCNYFPSAILSFFSIYSYPLSSQYFEPTIIQNLSNIFFLSIYSAELIS